MMTEYIYSMVYTIIYVVLLNLFVGIFESRRTINKYLFYIVQVALIGLDYGISYYFENQAGIKQLLVIAVNSAIIFALYILKIRKALVLSVLYQGCLLAVEYLSYVILQNAFEAKIDELTQNDIFCFLMGLLCLTILFCIISVIRKSLSIKLGYLLTEMEWLRFSVFPLFSIITIVAFMFNFEIVQDSKQGLILIWIMSGLVVMNILVFGLLSDALKRESKLADYRIIQERGKNDTELYQSMIKNYNEQRKMIHEFKNHMSCMASLFNQGEYERLDSYISQIQKGINQKQDLIDTNNKLVNVILNSKYLEASERDILLVIKANDLSDISIEDQDLVIVLSNLLNNAIEACEKSANRVIKLKIVKEKKRVVIAVSNNYEQEPVKIAGQYITSKKENEQYHGVGIENITDVVEKYNGTYAIKHENNLFQFSILIPI